MYNYWMEYEWDERKRQANIIKHGVDFSLAETFAWDTALDIEDDRKNYGESRRVPIGLVGSRL